MIASKTQYELKLTLDGKEVDFTEGETLYEVATRNRKDVPTLCYDERLDAFGGCRLCVVMVEGMNAPVASCTTKAAQGMVVSTSPPEIEKFRKTLVELVVSENKDAAVDPLRGYASQELGDLARRYGADGTRFSGRKSGHSREDDKNPFILRDYDNCISCYRCVRVCAEQEGDFAINIPGPRLRNTDHHRVWRPPRGLTMHLLRPVRPDLPDRSTRR